MTDPKPVEKAVKKLGEPDALFSQPRDKIGDFNFGADTAAVFDNMLDRSIPYYDEIQRMIGQLVSAFVTDGTNIYDMGCSTATTILHIAQQLQPGISTRFVGIDNSPEMLAIARQKIDSSELEPSVELREADLNRGVHIENASVVLFVLTLQFVRPLYREKLLTSVYEGMTKGGCLILVEKVLGEDSRLNRLFIDHYYELKRRNGYSDLEISQKREALENVLVPFRLDENITLLRDVGFSATDIFFKWYNFCGIVAVK